MMNILNEKDGTSGTISYRLMYPRTDKSKASKRSTTSNLEACKRFEQYGKKYFDVKLSIRSRSKKRLNEAVAAVKSQNFLSSVAKINILQISRYQINRRIKVKACI